MMDVAARVEKAVRGLRTPMKVAVMGCTVNGPGEARESDIGLACGRGNGVIFRNGRLLKKVKGATMVGEFIDEVRKLAREMDRGR